MATQPVKDLPIIEQFGPHRNYSSGLRLESAVEPDKLVQTHCCFCGMQCGIQLKVKDNQVIGFEPWEEFPFNQGMLCPKGVKRYLQGAHPDRLLKAYQRDPAAPGGFQPLAYEEAIQRVAQEIERIQSTYGPDSFAVFGGASLTTEKAYLLGKFARMGLEDVQHRLQRPAVHGQRGRGQQEGVRHRPRRQPVGGHCHSRGDLDRRLQYRGVLPDPDQLPLASTGERRKIIVVDPRITPIARTCDLFLPIKPGRDVALFNGILHLMIEKGWLDHDFIANHTVGFGPLAEHVKEWTPRRTAEVTGIAESAIRKAAQWWGTAKSSFLMHARGIEHHTHGVQNCLGAINIVLASGRIGRQGCGYATITGQGNGQGGREHGQKCDQLPGGRDIENHEHRAHVAKVWGISPDDLPRGGVDVYEIFRKVDRGEVRGLLNICFNPLVSLPDNSFVKRMLERLQFFVTIDFFMSETARYADIVLPGSLHEEDEGVVTSAEGRVIKINAAVECPGDARQDWRIIQDIARARARTWLYLCQPARDLRGAAPRLGRGDRGLLRHHL